MSYLKTLFVFVYRYFACFYDFAESKKKRDVDLYIQKHGWPASARVAVELETDEDAEDLESQSMQIRQELADLDDHGDYTQCAYYKSTILCYQ